MFEDEEDSRATAENNALDDMMANMLTVSADEGGILGGARAAVSMVSGGENKKNKKNNLTADEVEQASALKSWGDADLSDSMEETKRSPKSRRKKGRGGKRGRKKKSPRTSGGKSLLRPHGGAPMDGGGGGGGRDRRGRGSTKVMPLQQEQWKLVQKTQHFGATSLKSMTRLISLEHGIQSVQSGRHPVSAVAFEWHGKRMFVATEQGEATVWPSRVCTTSDNTHGGMDSHHSHDNDEVQCVPQLQQLVTTCHFEGGKVVTGYNDGTCTVYDADTGKRLMLTTPKSSNSVSSMENPGKVTVSSISEDGKTAMYGGGGHGGNDRLGKTFLAFFGRYYFSFFYRLLTHK